MPVCTIEGECVLLFERQSASSRAAAEASRERIASRTGDSMTLVSEATYLRMLDRVCNQLKPHRRHLGGSSRRNGRDVSPGPDRSPSMSVARSLPHDRYRTIATARSLPHDRYRTIATARSLPHDRYRTIATARSLPHDRYRTI
ncbi:hypothetical protein B2J88_44215, partial [Rhodococcus sp. SRB_17]|nr:hypothetical protein [Rhodococcus sp. SRB_17]